MPEPEAAGAASADAHVAAGSCKQHASFSHHAHLIAITPAGQWCKDAMLEFGWLCKTQSGDDLNRLTVISISCMNMLAGSSPGS